MRGRRGQRVAAVVTALVLASGVGVADATPARSQAVTAKDPVIVVNGLFGVGIVYEPLVARLRADGYQVWDYELPTLGTQDIRVTARR